MNYFLELFKPFEISSLIILCLTLIISRQNKNIAQKWSERQFYARTRTTIKPFTYYQPSNEQEYNNFAYNVPYSSETYQNHHNAYPNTSYSSINKYAKIKNNQYNNTVNNRNSKYNAIYYGQEDASDLQYKYTTGIKFID